MKDISSLMLHVFLHIMDFTRMKKNETAIIIAIIIAFALFGLWLRLLPMDQLTSGPMPKVIFMDPWYSMRQIEVIASNFPLYPWFDPMTAYPTGKSIDWGPLYPTLSAAIVILFGASNRPDIMMVASWIPPIFSLIMIPALYLLGKVVADKKTGFIAACLISVIAGEYLYRSFYGYLDHHFLEVIFSTIFILIYLMILKTIECTDIADRRRNSKLIFLAALAGLTYYAGMMNMPTMVLFVGIIGIFCYLHAMISRDEKTFRSLVLAHSIIFGIFIILFALTGIQEDGLSLDKYSPVHLLIAFCLIIEPVVLWAILHCTSNKSNWQSTGAILGLTAVVMSATYVFAPAIFGTIVHGIDYFFFFSYENTLIFEMQMWDFTRAFHSFNIALLFMACGIVITFFSVLKKYNPILLFTLIWSFIILFSTIMHVRYEYYAAVIVVLFCALSLSGLYTALDTFLKKSSEKIISKKKDQILWGKHAYGSQYIPLFCVALIILVITGMSSQMTYDVATKQLPMISMNDDWAYGLSWLEKNTPEPGVDYLGIYEKDSFSYPKEAFGVLSTWDYGHWISYYGKRIPITTPFQTYVHPVAQFLIATQQKDADVLAHDIGARYIIIDYEMLSSKFSTFPLWGIGSGAKEKYLTYYFQQSESMSNKFEPILTLKPDYFHTMLSRLYIFDGSHTNSTGGTLIRYSNRDIGGETIPVISRSTVLSPDEADEIYERGLESGTDLVSVQYTRPTITMPALTHYRLIYESPTRIAADEYAQLHRVKIFERVHGYQISGDGTLELPLITNQGRDFVYRQESTNGMFILPYSTQREGVGVKATGPYTNVQTGETYEVSEDQVLAGI